MNHNLLLVIPAFNCENQLSRVCSQLDQDWVKNIISQVVIFENQSTDNTLEVAKSEAKSRALFLKVFQNDENYGLGGTHKIAFDYAKNNGFEWVLILHGDDQGSLVDFKNILQFNKFTLYDAILGSRFMPESNLLGYSKTRIFGNYIFNFIYSLLLGSRISDLGSGLNMYKVSSLPIGIERAPDDLTFNCVLLISLISHSRKLLFSPITWRESDQVSNVKLVKQAIKTILIPIWYFISPNNFLKADHRKFSKKYSSTQIS